MRKRNREFSIFSLSAIDLFCAGMGAVMLLAVILMPFYMRPEARELLERLASMTAERDEALAARAEAEADARSARSERDAAAAARAEAERERAAAERRAEDAGRDLAAAERRAEAAERRAGELAREADAMKARLATPFLVVAISWDNPGADIDLHVTDPDGRHYFFRQRRHSGSPAYIEVDSVNGPGNEVWIHPAATAGVYRVEYVYYLDQAGSGAATVRGVALYQGGRLEFARRTLPRADEGATRHLAAELVVTPDGEVELR